MNLNATSQEQPTGYEDIDNLNKAQSELYDKAYQEQQNIVNTQTQQTIDDINRNKDKLNEETTKQNQALYTDYMKQINPYGVNTEALVENGLGNSGASETSRVNLYNTYQKNRTDTLNTARNVLAEYNAQMVKAKQNGDIQLAKAAMELYNQKIDGLYRNYQLLQNRQQFEYQIGRDQVADDKWKKEFDYNKAVNDRNYNYQVDRDKISDSQWQKEYDYNKSVNDRNYNYQINRDKVTDNQWQQQFDHNKATDDRNYNYQIGRDQVSDSQWQKEYELQKKNLARSASRNTIRSSSGGQNQLVVSNNEGNNHGKYTPEEVLKNMKMIQGPNVEKTISDGISGKTFSSPDELLAYYGYASIDG